jgi:hypothetical protein
VNASRIGVPVRLKGSFADASWRACCDVDMPRNLAKSVTVE